MKHLKYGDLSVVISADRASLGIAAAEDFAGSVNRVLKTQDELAVILATGNSQLPFVESLLDRRDIDWSRISVLHMDEYLGMPATHPASFRRWMQENLVTKVHPKAFYGVEADHEPIHEELARYADLIRALKPAICVMGIGENGHLAFNDPPADFETRALIHVVDLDEECRMQQVGEGHFPSIVDTPDRALSLTVRALLQPETVMVLTPEARKAKAVKRSLEGPVTPECPASILQTASNARLYLDAESSALLESNTGFDRASV